VPGGVRHECRQNDRPDAFGDNVTEQQLQCGNKQRKHQNLSKLDAYVEREQGSQQMGSGELQRLPQSE